MSGIAPFYLDYAGLGYWQICIGELANLPLPPEAHWLLDVVEPNLLTV